MNLGRTSVAGGITLSLFVFRALSKVVWPPNPVVDFFINPNVVFACFLIAATIVMYPFLRGRRALFVAPLIVILIAFFVYAYYVLP